MKSRFTLVIFPLTLSFSAITQVPAEPPIQGDGSRLMWMPVHGAFRAGYAANGGWDVGKIGLYSTAFGHGTKASATASTAFGDGTLAGEYAATAFGDRSSAGGFASAAFGSRTSASGQTSTAFGLSTIASGKFSTVFGAGSIASGDFSTAMGYLVSTGGFTGSTILGDGDPNLFLPITANDAENQMMMRFSGGYKLFSNDLASIGTELAPGSNAWSTLSDRNKKEMLLPVDGERFLKAISKMPLNSWNYKGQDCKIHRHYGPMAQDFYIAFGKDALGTIGNDTTINQADFDGINLIGVQALEYRTSSNKRELDKLQQEVFRLKEAFKKLKGEYNEVVDKLKKKVRK